MDVKEVLKKVVLPGGLVAAILAGCSLNKEGMGAKAMVTPQPMDSDTENKLNVADAYSVTVGETSTATTEEVTKEPTVQEENAVDETQVSFEQLMNTMKENDLRRVVSEDAMKLVETFHNQTQKEGNFRLEEDGEVNLDLTYEEAFVLSTVVNYSDSQEMYDIFGDYNITSEKAKELFSSARKKIMIYYMNAVEPSGIKEIFHNENDRDFFGQIENDVLAFNKDHSVEKSDQIARDVYYDYILEKFSISVPNNGVSSFAKLLSLDAVYGGRVLVDSAYSKYDQLLVFHGGSEEDETRYLVENIYHKNYDELSKEELDYYRKMTLKESAVLLKIRDGVISSTDDSTKTIIGVADREGLCDLCDNNISEMFDKLNQQVSSDNNKEEIVRKNYDLVCKLYDANQNDLALEVANSLFEPLKSDLLRRISNVEGFEDIEKTYQIDDSRASVADIIVASEKELGKMDGYSSMPQDGLSVLEINRIGNERKILLDSYPDVSIDNDIDNTDATNYSDNFEDEEYDNGHDQTTSDVTELSLESQAEKEQEYQNILDNVIKSAESEGMASANSYANSNEYKFENDFEDTFVNVIEKGYVDNVSTDDEQIQKAAAEAADKYVNSLSEDDIKGVAIGLGISEADAKERIKEAFKEAFISQIGNEITTAIEVRNEIETAMEEEVDENTGAGITETPIEEGEKEPPSESVEQDGNSVESSNDDVVPKIEEGEKEIPSEPDELGGNSDFVEEQVSPNEETSINESDVTEGEKDIPSESNEQGGNIHFEEPISVESTYDTTKPINEGETSEQAEEEPSYEDNTLEQGEKEPSYEDNTSEQAEEETSYEDNTSEQAEEEPSYEDNTLEQGEEEPSYGDDTSEQAEEESAYGGNTSEPGGKVLSLNYQI